MIFSPFLEHRFSWDLVFVIDLFFSGIIFFPFMISTLWKNKAQWICQGSLVSLILYIFFCWVQHQKALELTKAFAGKLNEEVLQVASLPQPISPFRWANYVETKDKVYQGFVNLTLKEFPLPINGQTESPSNFVLLFERLKNLYHPPQKVHFQSYQKFHHSSWVEKALATEGVKFFYWFAQFPVVKSVNIIEGRHRVEFMDVRFLIPGIRLPFIYSVEFDKSGKIQSEGFLEE
jgi:hypothetical protein